MFPLVMGVVNVTPDSFSDGGCWADPAAAIAHGLELVAAGADIIDVGGESTRPGAQPVSVDDELRRVMPVIEALSGRVRLSIDTMKPQVAERAVVAGATIINDVSGSTELSELAAAYGVGWVCMHMRGTPRTMQDDPRYDDVVSEVRDWLVDRADTALAGGAAEIWIDPGIGFGKTLAHNLSLLAHVADLVETGIPVAVGTSRKSFLGRLLADADGVSNPVPTGDRLAGSVATAALALAAGASMVRVHDVAATVAARRVVCDSISLEVAA